MNKIIVNQIFAALSLMLFLPSMFVNCSSDGFKASSFSPIVNASTIADPPPILPVDPSLIFACSGIVPANTVLCTGDDFGLVAATSRMAVQSCTTAQKCEHICNAGFNLVGGICVAALGNSCVTTLPCTNAISCSIVTGNPIMPNQPWLKGSGPCGFSCINGYTGTNCQTPPAGFACQGSAPANSALCAGDDTGLTANSNRTLAASCTVPTKCEYLCNAGYNLTGGVCVQAVGNSCAPPPPCTNGVNCGLLTGTPSSQNQPWVLNSSNCGFSCINGYTGTNCQMPPVSFSCSGNAPANASLCGNDETGLTANTPRTAVQSCTLQTKCEYQCNGGYNLFGGICVAQASSCSTTLPCTNGLNCNLQTGAPIAANQGWVKNANNCGFSCINGYTGANCETLPVVTCQVAQFEFPIPTHWSNSQIRFSEGATDQIQLNNPNVLADRRIYNHGLLPLANRYIGDNYEITKIEDSQFQNWANSECITANIAIELRKPASYSDWSIARNKLVESRGSIQILHALISENNLVTIIIPPNWKKSDPAGKYPILFSGVYDLKSSVITKDQTIIQAMAHTFNTSGAPFIGVIWNGGGAVGSRTANPAARAWFNTIIQKVAMQFGGDSQKIFTYGGSRGGITALMMAANPENYPYRVVATYAAVPPSDIPSIADLTGASVPFLIGAAEWSIGLLHTWSSNFVYPALGNNLTGLSRNDAHINILSGSHSKSDFENSLNVTSPYVLNSLKSKNVKIFLEIGSHDFIVPWLDQFKLARALDRVGISHELRVNYLAGHWADSASAIGVPTRARLSEIMAKVKAGNYDSIFSLGSKNYYMNEFSAGGMQPTLGQKFTFEFPRYQSPSVGGHIIMTGVPGTQVRFVWSFNEVTAAAPFEVTLNSEGYAVTNLSTLGAGLYRVLSIEILKPGTSIWKSIDMQNSTTGFERGRLKLEVLAADVDASITANEISIAILKGYLGEALDLATNGFGNVSYGVAEK